MVTALVWGASLNARAAVTLQYLGGYYESGYSDDKPNYLIPADAIGIYKFNMTDAKGTSEFWSVCLDPQGVLDTGIHSYTPVSFDVANPGNKPSAWAWGMDGTTKQYWGINNAAYLWKTFGMSIVNNEGNIGHQSERAAGLEFAIWNTLYNSTAYGKVTANNWTPPTMTGDVLTSYIAFNKALADAQNIPSYEGNILRSTETGAEQELFMLGTIKVTSVPEPPTLIAGSVALLSLGASMFGTQRKNAAV